MSDQMTFEDLHSATGSPELEDGATLSGSLEYQTMNLFGLDLVPVSPSARPANRKPKPTRAISGLYGFPSSASVALQESLESRLLARLPLDGWTKPLMTWKRKHTPSRRQYCQLAVSALPIAETDCGLWPTPAARDHFPAHSSGYVAEKKAQGHGMSNLNDAVELWPTPQSRDWKSGSTPSPLDHNARPLNEVAMWATPAAQEPGGTAEASLARKRKAKAGGAQLGISVTNLSFQVQPSSAETESAGQLNPQFVSWLMGYPAEWAYFEDLEAR